MVVSEADRRLLVGPESAGKQGQRAEGVAHRRDEPDALFCANNIAVL